MVKNGCPVGFMQKDNMCYRRVKSPDELVSLIKKGYNDYFLLLGGIARSSKRIEYVPHSKKPFTVWNFIDDTTQHLSKEELMSDYETNIGLGIRRGYLWCETRVKKNG